MATISSAIRSDLCKAVILLLINAFALDNELQINATDTGPGLVRLASLPGEEYIANNVAMIAEETDSLHTTTTEILN